MCPSNIPVEDRLREAITAALRTQAIPTIASMAEALRHPRLLAFLACLSVLVVACSGGRAHGPGVGREWIQDGLHGIFVHSIAFGPGLSSVAFAGTERGLFRRTRGGLWKNSLHHQEVWGVTVARGEVLAVDNAGQVDISRDGGRHWRRTSISRQGAYAVTVRPGHPSWMLVGAGGGIYLSRNGGRSWSRQLRLRNSATDAFAWVPGSARLVFAANVSGGGPRPAPPVMISRDAGLTWHPDGRNLTRAGVMSLLPLRGGRLLAGTMGHSVWRATSGNDTWTWSGAGMPRTNDHGSGLVTIPKKPNEVFVGTLSYGVFRSTNYGASWRNVSQGLPSEEGAHAVLSLAYSRGERSIYAATPSGLYRMKVR